MSLFLSYAQEDSETANTIARRLEERGHIVYRFEDRQQRGGTFISRIETEIGKAQGFIALVSPSYVSSRWCRWERELAFIREIDLQKSGAAEQFVHVIQVQPTPHADSGGLQRYDWHDYHDSHDLDHVLEALDARMGANGPATSEAAARPAPTTGRALSVFRNREHELQRIIQGITTPGGIRFWLVVAPPQLGKSWLLDKTSEELTANAAGGWRVRLVDVGDLPFSVRSDVSLLLNEMFPAVDPNDPPPGSPREVARMISGEKRPYACLLDGADLLNQRVAKGLRQQLAEIHQRLQSSGLPSARLAIVVAGRREEEWRGLRPEPRLESLTLTRFRSDTITLSLQDLAAQMGRTFGAREQEIQVQHVHRFTEGLPALLWECLLWLRRDNWADIEDLDTPQLFADIAQPYVEKKLLSIESLVPEGGPDVDAVAEVLSQALRLLTRYRILTQSHLAHHWDTDAEFGAVVTRGGWLPPDLWSAVSRTALLSRPLDEVWAAIHPPIRRLLFRYFHPTDAERGAAHREAAGYVEEWMASQRGKEACVGVVERLWHEASALLLERPGELDTELSATAERMLDFLQPSRAYGAEELRQFVAHRVMDDEELQDVLSGVPGLSDRLVAIILSSAGGSGE
jgi:hypothetical protein